jgi:hypothetical protein
MIGVDESLVQLRQKYIPIGEKILPGKKTAMFSRWTGGLR